MKNLVEYNDTKNAANQAQHTWVEGILEKIEEIIEEQRAEVELNFPLSGGEEQLHIYKEENEERGHYRTSFLQDLETEFPLSGGEIER